MMQFLHGTNSSARNSWECAFCHRRSREERRVVVTIDDGRQPEHRVRCCDLECLRRLLALWEELEIKKVNDALFLRR